MACWTPAGRVCARARSLQLDAEQFERWPPRAAARSGPVIPRAAGRCCAMRWRCGAVRRWPTSPMSRSRRPTIARLEEARLAALEDRIDADLALGEQAELVGELEALVARASVA